MVKFRTKYEQPAKKYFSVAGNPLKIKYKGYYTEDGNFDLLETGKDNLYQYIQSFKDSVDIHVILSKYINGDISALNARTPLFGDFSSIPDNFPEILNIVSDTKEMFDKLPVEVKEKFGNNFAAFAASVGSPDFAEKLQVSPAVDVAAAAVSPVENVESEVKSVSE